MVYGMRYDYLQHNIEYAPVMFACLECLKTSLAQEFCDSFQLRLQCLSMSLCMYVFMCVCICVFI